MDEDPTSAGYGFPAYWFWSNPLGVYSISTEDPPAS